MTEESEVSHLGRLGRQPSRLSLLPHKIDKLEACGPSQAGSLISDAPHSSFPCHAVALRRRVIPHFPDGNPTLDPRALALARTTLPGDRRIRWHASRPPGGHLHLPGTCA